MASKHLFVLTLLLGFLLIELIQARAESIEFAGYGEKKLSNVVVVGSVFCDTCLKHQLSRESGHVITGALVTLECGINCKTTTSIIVGKSDEYGDFGVEVPSLKSRAKMAKAGVIPRLIELLHSADTGMVEQLLAILEAPSTFSESRSAILGHTLVVPSIGRSLLAESDTATDYAIWILLGVCFNSAKKELLRKLVMSEAAS